jgi:Ca2+-binding RTX toxin-like protein
MLGRAPSTAELTDLVTKANAGSTLQELADSLASDVAFTASYPVWLTATEFTKQVVANTFAGGSVAQADVDAAVDYIAGAITAGTFTKTSAVVALTNYLASADGVANATYGSAAQSYQNKVAVAEYYTITKGLGGNSVADLTAAIAGVTSDAATVTSEKAAVDTAQEVAAAAAIEAAKPKAQDVTLTTKLDTGAAFTGGSTDDTFNALMTFSGNALTAAATMTSGDTLVGGAGTDTLEITVTGGNLSVTDAGETATPTLTGIENVWVRSFETDASLNDGATTNLGQDSVIINLSNATGVTGVGTTATNNVEADVSFTAITGIPLVTMSGKGDLKVLSTAASTAGLSDSATLNLNDVGTSAGAADSAAMSDFDMQNIETLTINSGGGSNFLGLSDGEYTTVNVTGDQALTLDLNDAAVTVFDASASTGKLSVDASALTLANVTSAKGGAGTSDTLTLGGADLAASALLNPLKNFSGFETLAYNTTNNITLATAATGINAFNLSTGDQILTLNDGYTGDTTVTMGQANDAVVNSANVTLTVSGIATTLTGGTTTGGTGTDTMNAFLDAATRTVAAGFTKFETINILSGPTTPTIAGGLTLNDANVAAGKTLTINGALVGNALAVITIDGSNEADGSLVITGGAAKDILTGGALGDTIDGGANNDTIDGGAGNDTLTGGAGADIITIGAGTDTVSGGEGKDVIIAAGNLGAADVIDGGEGADTLRVTALSATALAGVTNVETLQLTGGSSASVAANLAFDTIDLSQGATTETVTLTKGYTSATTFKVDDGDTVTNTSADAVITITGAVAAFEAADNTIITGSDKAGVTNSMILDNGDIGGSVSATVDFAADITNIDSVTINDWAFLAGNDVTLALASYATALTIDVSSFDAGEKATITGVSAKAITFTGGQGGDTVVLSGGNDTMVLGNGKNVITAAGNLSYEDTVTGGTSTDTMSGTGVSDVDFQNVSSVEVLAAAGGATLGTFADAAGIRIIAHDATNAVAATTMTSDIKILASAVQTDTWTGGLGNDELAFTSTGTLTAADVLNGGGGTANFISLSNDDDDAGTVGEATSGTLDRVSKIQTVKIKDTATDNSAGDVALIVTNIAYDQTSMTVDAADLDAGEDFAFSANAITQTDEAFIVTGGSGNDTIIGGAGADTITGGSGADIIDGNGGADTLTGGGGVDRFRYVATDSTSAKKDSITDFTATTDSLTVNIGTRGSATQNVNMVDVGDAASLSDGLSLLSGKPGEYFFDTTNEQVAIDIDGNGLIQSSDLIIALPGNTGFSSADMDMVVTGGNAALTVTGGAGNDRVNTVSGENDVNTYSLGAGNDTYLLTDAGEVDIFIENASGGTDTIATSAGIDITGIKFGTTAAQVANGPLTNFEQIVAKQGATLTLDSGQLSGLTIAINTDAAGVLTIAAPGPTSGTNVQDFSGITTAAVSYLDASGDAATGIALDAADIITVTGGTGADTISAAPTIKNNITPAAGPDIITLNSGIDTVILVTADRTTVNTVTGFTSATDKINTIGLTAGTGIAANVISGVTSSVSTTGLKNYNTIITTDGTAGSVTLGSLLVLTPANMTAGTLTAVAAFIAAYQTGNSNTIDADNGVFAVNLNHASLATQTFVYSWDNDTSANAIQAAELKLIANVTSADFVAADIVHA